MRDGTWRGAIADGEAIGFIVSQDKITSFWFTVKASEPLNNIECTGKIECLEGQACASHSDQPIAIGTDGSFTLSYGGAQFAGAFSSTAVAAGSIDYYLLYADPCTGVDTEGTTTWSAYKHQDASTTATLSADALPLVGSWEVEYSNMRNCSSCRTGTAGWELLADGTLCSTGTSGYRASACSLGGSNVGTWSVDGTAFSGTIYAGFSSYTGSITGGESMQGTATNQSGAAWDWTAKKRE